MRIVVGAIVLSLFVTILGGCASAEKDERADAFKSSTKQYGALIRWGKYSNAMNFLKTRDGEILRFDPSPLEGIKVTRYRIISVKQHADEVGASVVAKIDYYHDTNFSVHTIVDVQDWWYDEEAKQWFVNGALPAFR